VQRFGGALNLNIHFHSLMIDGVFVREGDGMEFLKVGPPTEHKLQRVVDRTVKRITEMMKGHGLAVGWTGEPEVEESEPPTLFDWIQGASVREWVTMGTSMRPVPVVGRTREAGLMREPPPLVARQSGFNVHAGVRIRGSDREGLEKLCRYALRPAFSQERLERLEDGRISYRFRHARPDGSTHVVLTPLELLEKLAALVPPPRAHLMVYHGVLAPNSRHRKSVVPVPPDKPPPHGHAPAAEPGKPGRRRGRKRLDWANLLKRTLGIDVLFCPRCHGRMKVIACIEELAVIRRILGARGLPLEGPKASPARPPPGQQGFEFDQEGDEVA